jgi:hypothetical protein
MCQLSFTLFWLVFDTLNDLLTLYFKDFALKGAYIVNMI